MSASSSTVPAPAVPATARPPLWFIQDLATIHLGADETAGACDLVEMVGPRGDMPPLHVHETQDEGFYVVEGSLRVHVGRDRVIDLAAGDFAWAPRGVPHVYEVTSDRARWLALASPGGFAAFVAEVGVPAVTPTLPPADVRPDPARLAAVAAEHGIVILGPPGMLPSELADVA